VHTGNEVLPLTLARYCGAGPLGHGVTALVAGFMSGMAGNVSAFATIWTYDDLQASAPKASHRLALRFHGVVVLAAECVCEHLGAVVAAAFIVLNIPFWQGEYDEKALHLHVVFYRVVTRSLWRPDSKNWSLCYLCSLPR
jgi:hypothetical protein